MAETWAQIKNRKYGMTPTEITTVITSICVAVVILVVLLLLFSYWTLELSRS